MGNSSNLVKQGPRLGRLIRGHTKPAELPPTPTASGMDTPPTRPSIWRRYAPHALGGILASPFEDFIAVRSTAAPFITNYLITDQGGTVKEVLAEDGGTLQIRA